MAIDFSRDELYEINDAIGEVVKRMMDDGQTEQEIRMRSLDRLWSAWQKVTTEVCGTAETPGLQKMKPLIEIAIANPKFAYATNYRR